MAGVALLMRGLYWDASHHRNGATGVNWMHSIEAQRRWLFDPFRERNVTVDVVLASAAKEYWDRVQHEYERLARSTGGELIGAVNSSTSRQQDKIAAGLNILRGQWRLVIVWRFDVEPLVPITEWRIGPDVTLPFREANMKSVTSCRDLARRWWDATKYRLSDVAFVLGRTAIVPHIADAISRNYHPQNALHYMLQDEVKAGQIAFSLDGLWDSGQANPLYRICRGLHTSSCSTITNVAASSKHCCDATRGDFVDTMTRHHHRSLLSHVLSLDDDDDDNGNVVQTCGP